MVAESVAVLSSRKKSKKLWSAPGIPIGNRGLSAISVSYFQAG